MKLSEIDKAVLTGLSDEQKWNVVCGGVKDDGWSAEAALLLGGRPTRAVERALAAAQLYREGRVNVIVASGGVEWDYQGERISEATLMARILRSEGVPEEAIILENEARTTIENMIYGTLQLSRRYDNFLEHVIIVTSVFHMKRSLALAKALLPRKTKVSAYPSYPNVEKEDWLRSEENYKFFNDGLRLLKELVDQGDVEDLEIDINGVEA